MEAEAARIDSPGDVSDGGTDGSDGTEGSASKDGVAGLDDGEDDSNQEKDDFHK